MSLADRLFDLLLEIEACALEPLSLTVKSGWTRRTTLVHLMGGGRRGAGEDVCYGSEEQLLLQAGGPPAVPAGRFTLGEFCAEIGRRDLFPQPPSLPQYRDYRRWAFESAALDLALRQAGLSLAAAIGHEPQPLRFCASMGLGDPPSLARPLAMRAIHPALEFKLDAEPNWDDDVVRALADLGGIGVVDLKGAYVGTPVDVPPDPALARRVAESLPDAIIEDPHRTPEVLAVLEPYADRIAWDAPIHSVRDLDDLPFPPRILNVKPSRVGSVENLFALYERCEREGIETYGGGQFELGVGRRQIQRLAALFHPDAPNDTSPAAYHVPDVAADLPASPLPPTASAPGL